MFLGRALRVRYFVEGHVVVLIQFKECVHHIFRCIEGRFVDGAVVTQKELDDPSWKPPFEAGLIVHHMVYHGNENSPHIHMTYIPYTTNSSKGAPIQNAFAQTFKDLGYPTTMRQAVTKTGELVWQKDEDGKLKPQMKRDRYGGADWVETQKAVLQDMMLKEFGWERFYKGSNPRGNLTLSDYRREKAAEMAKEEE